MGSMYRKTKQMRDFEPILKRNGFRYLRSHGSHFTYINTVTHKRTNELQLTKISIGW